jgi:hypothetical protein
MRKRLVDEIHKDSAKAEREWINVEELAEVELTSEIVSNPIEAALLPKGHGGWRAGTPGSQTIRLLFANPQRIHRVHLNFVELHVERTQEYVLRWSPDDGQSFQEIVRQQWNFSPLGTTSETEDYDVELANVTILELSINPDIGNHNAIASLERWRIA